MPRDSNTNRTLKTLAKDPEPPSADAATNITVTAASSELFPRVRIFPSTGSLASVEDRQEDERTHITNNHHNDNTADHQQYNSFPARPLEPSSHAAATALPAITSPSSATAGSLSTNSLNDFRGSPQKSSPVVHQQQHRLSKSSLTSTPPRSTETAQLARCSPVTTSTTERRRDCGTRRASKTDGGNRASSLSATPPAHPPSLNVRGSSANITSPPPVSFSFHAATPTAQRSPPFPQVPTSPTPQLVQLRPASRSRPYISGGGLAGSPSSTPQAHGIPTGDALTLPSPSCTPHHASAALPRTPSGHQTPVPYPSLHSPVSLQYLSLHVAAPVPFSSIDNDDDDDNNATVAAAPDTTEEDQKDLLVEKIIQNPHKMGQSNGSCEKAYPPRGTSNSRSSPEESGSRPARSHSHAELTPKRTDSLSCCKDGRRTPSASPANEKSAQERPDTPTVPLNSAEVDDADWVFQRPPNNQRTFYFKEDNLEFSSQFDSGNLIQVERVGPFQYRMYTAMDCGNSAWQTNNRQWFHFSLRGGSKGAVVTFTFVGMMHSNMFNFDWMPVTAVTPSRPEYTRLPGKAKVESLENMPETPGYPLLVYKAVSKDDADSDGDNNEDDNDADNGAAANTTNNNNNNNNTSAGEGVAFSVFTTNGKCSAASKKKKSRRKRNLAMNLTFDYRIEAEVPVTHTPPRGFPDVASIYIASNHPYTYSRLQRNLRAWKELAQKSNATRSQSVQTAAKAVSSSCSEPCEPTETRGAQTPSNTHFDDNTADGSGATKSTVEVPFTGIYYHSEVLCKTLEGHDVTLLTISDRSRMTMGRAPLISDKDGIPHSSATRTTQRPFAFSGKRYVVLTARVHPGECPGSHLMHGCIEFLLHHTDPRAIALRHHFVFYIVPMLNPDGVIRGHSRVDANGVDLNRMYRTPSRKRHPAPYAVMALLKSLGDRVALFIDMHAHANKRGTFFYGNSMDGAEQVENLLYAKLVSLNTPYLDFRSCNFSEANMFAVGKSGKGKDSSSRVVVFTEAGVVHGYTIETSHVMADAVNPIVALVNARGEQLEKVLPMPLQLTHTPATFGDTGRAMLVALLDLKSINPLSRLSFTPYHSTRGVSLWLQRQLQIETAEMLFAQAFKAHGKEVQAVSHETGNNLLGPIMRSLTADEFPDKVTIKKARLLPRTTYSDVRSFLPVETAVTLLSQTTPTGPPRSLLCASTATNGNGGGHGRRRGGSLAAGANSGVTASSPVGEPPAVIATKRRPRPNAPGADMTAEF